jgi:hypothetical protein
LREEQAVLQRIKEVCNIQDEDLVNIPYPGHGGVFTLAAMKNPNTNTIYEVPIDSRDACKELLLQSLKRPHSNGRVDLLCCAGYRGTGKTVLQTMNMQWFAEETNGISMEVTFFDDQAAILPGRSINSNQQFSHEVALRILHRIEFLRQRLILGWWSCETVLFLPL